ncbi:MAG: hypothetical protein QME47_02530, partial [Candidatus Thermoplasmatota archaeon]|nr:hypothetical protein [Candidatus Thermoplasmatota archaeon]
MNNKSTPTIGKIGVRVFNKCVRLLSGIKLPTEKEPTYKEEDIFSVLAIANILQWAVESVVSQIELMKIFGLYFTKYPSSDIVFTRLKRVERKDLPCLGKEIIRKLVRKAKRLKLIGKKVDLAIDFHKVPRHTKKRF